MTQQEIVDNIKSRFSGRVWDLTERPRKKVYLTIDAADIREMARFLHVELGMRFNIASAVDEFEAFEILYHFSKDEAGLCVSVRVFLKDKDNPRIDSLLPLMCGAEWIEREIHELFGIEFAGHPNIKPLLLPEDWPAGVYPLRRDFVAPKREDRGQA